MTVPPDEIVRVAQDGTRATNPPNDYWEDTQRAGFDIYFVFVAHSWFKLGALDNSDRNGNENPDMQTFDNLEYIINYAHSRGGRTHIWAWGDTVYDCTISLNYADNNKFFAYGRENSDDGIVWILIPLY